MKGKIHLIGNNLLNMAATVFVNKSKNMTKELKFLNQMTLKKILTIRGKSLSQLFSMYQMKPQT